MGREPALASASLRTLLLLVSAIALVQILCIRPGHSWGDDFAHYILQAKHLITLHSYVAREYIPNPDVLNLAPQTVPPGLSVFLAPVYALWGLNLTAMKILLVIVFMAGLCFLDPLLSERLPRNWRYALIAIVGLDPLIFRMRDEIETEKLFLPLLLLALWLMREAYRRTHPSMRLAAATGAAIFAACMTRNVGFALFPILPVLDLLRFRKIRGFTLVSLAVAGIPTALLLPWLRSTSGYVQLFNFSPLWILHSAWVYAKTFEQYWWAMYPRWIGYAVLVVVACLAVRGVYVTLRKDFGPIEVFIVCYLGIVLPYALAGYVHYLIPLFLFLIAYALAGLHDLTAGTRWYRPAAVTGIICTALLFGAVYARENWGKIDEGVGNAQFMEVCDYISRQTSASDIVVFRKPRLLALMTGHPSTVYPMHLDRPPEPAEILAYFEKVHAGYVVIAHISHPEFSEDPIVERTINGVPSLGRVVYSNPQFVIYKLNSRPS